MKTRLLLGVLALLVCLSFAARPPAVTDPKTDPCRDEDSNASTRACYLNAERRVNALARSYANQIVAKNLHDAQTAEYGPIIADGQRKTAFSLRTSQKSWEAFRDEYCNAVMYSYTTGSGAGTAHEECMFKTGRERVLQLRNDFGGYIKQGRDSQ